MKGMRVDPVARTVQTEPGLTWGELNHDLQVFELGASGGFVSITGIPGLTLGGGFGWVVRKHGLAMDNLLSVDIVTADGRFLTASSSQNSDLFWGVRGGGGNFGAHRDLTYNFLVTSEWADRADSERNIRWTRQFWEAVQPFLAKAVYVNYTSDEGDDVIKAAYAANVRERLVALKNKYDPTNLFRLNQNIKPTV
jgi:FAD/FMN-containing dehydrogenase